MIGTLDPMIVDLPHSPMTNSTGCQRIEILTPVIVDLTYTLMTISTGCQIVHLDHQNAKSIVLKK